MVDPPRLPRSVLNDLIVFATKRSHFVFDGQFYDQVDGVAMGSPLGPVLANIKEKWVFHNNVCLTVWFRYVDDTLTLFCNKDTAINFLHYLNSRHNNMQFTIEFERNCEIPFLNVLLKCNQNNSFSTSLCRKKPSLVFALNATPLHHISIRVISSTHFLIVVSTSVRQSLYYSLLLMI